MNKKIISVGIAFCLFLVEPCYADENTPILTQIQNTVNTILIDVNNIPALINDIIIMAKSWNQTTDQHSNIATNQPNFSNLATDYNAIGTNQTALSTKLTAQIFATCAPTNQTDLNFNTFLSQQQPAQQGQAPTPPTSNYLSYASGASLVYTQGSPQWNPSSFGKQYTSLYNTVTAVASYNAYILGSLNNQQDQDTQRTSLITQATGTQWFSDIGSEYLGLVLRQLLMYTSQIYVQLTTMIKIQQQQLAAQAMTNTLLLINANYGVGNTLTLQAKNAPPSPAGAVAACPT